jgi:hypothetical protein
MTLEEKLDDLVRKHGATSYRHRSDTQNPAFGFTPSGLLNLLAEVTGEVRKQDEALIRQMLEAMTPVAAYGRPGSRDIEQASLQAAITAARTCLGGIEEESKPNTRVYAALFSDDTWTSPMGIVSLHSTPKSAHEAMVAHRDERKAEYIKACAEVREKKQFAGLIGLITPWTDQHGAGNQAWGIREYEVLP